MTRSLIVSLVLSLSCAMSFAGAQNKQAKKPAAKKNVFTSAAEAGPDFQVQGEYEGAGGKGGHAAQVVALGDGKFDVYLLTGGLPGAGWDRKGRQKVSGRTELGKTVLKGAGWSGTIADGKLTARTEEGKEIALKR